MHAMKQAAVMYCSRLAFAFVPSSAQSLAPTLSPTFCTCTSLFSSAPASIFASTSMTDTYQSREDDQYDCTEDDATNTWRTVEDFPQGYNVIKRGANENEPEKMKGVHEEKDYEKELGRNECIEEAHCHVDSIPCKKSRSKDLTQRHSETGKIMREEESQRKLLPDDVCVQVYGTMEQPCLQHRSSAVNEWSRGEIGGDVEEIYPQISFLEEIHPVQQVDHKTQGNPTIKHIQKILADQGEIDVGYGGLEWSLLSEPREPREPREVYAGLDGRNHGRSRGSSDPIRYQRTRQLNNARTYAVSPKTEDVVLVSRKAYSDYSPYPMDESKDEGEGDGNGLASMEEEIRSVLKKRRTASIEVHGKNEEESEDESEISPCSTFTGTSVTSTGRDRSACAKCAFAAAATAAQGRGGDNELRVSTSITPCSTSSGVLVGSVSFSVLSYDSDEDYSTYSVSSSSDGESYHDKAKPLPSTPCDTPFSPNSLGSQESSQSTRVCNSRFNFNFSLTVGLCILTCLCSLAIPKVSWVWQLLGSSVTLVVSMLIPSLIFVKFVHSRRLFNDKNFVFAWVLAIVSGIVIILLTYHTLFLQTTYVVEGDITKVVEKVSSSLRGDLENFAQVKSFLNNY